MPLPRNIMDLPADESMLAHERTRTDSVLAYLATAQSALCIASRGKNSHKQTMSGTAIGHALLNVGEETVRRSTQKRDSLV